MNINIISLDNPLVLNLKEFKSEKITKLLWIFIILSLFSISIFYIFQINAETSEKYALIAYEKNLSNLIQKKESLNVLAADSASLKNVISLLENYEKNFIKTEKVHHLKIIGNNIVSI